MKRSKFSDQLIAFLLRQGEEGASVEEVCRKAGISVTHYPRRKKYGGLMPSEMKRLKQLEEENQGLKRLVADLNLDKEMLQEVVGQSSEACQAARSTDPYESHHPPQAVLKKRILEIAQTRVRYDYRRMHVLLGHEGWQANVKHVYRLYSDEGRQLRNKTPKRKVLAKLREDRCFASEPNEVWAMDFMSDQLFDLFDGRRIRILTIIDAFSRLPPAIDVRQSYRGSDVVETLERITRVHGKPRTIRVDNGRSSSARRWICGPT